MFWLCLLERAESISTEYLTCRLATVRSGPSPTVRSGQSTDTNASIVQRESDSSWVEGMLVALYPSIQCWRQKGNDSSDLELLTKEYIRFKQSWQKGKEWRRDYVWVQDTKAGNNSPLGGRKVG
jgi:hypothetical protein